ncbi:3'-5'-exoribonuclease [Dimargaris xerosporica]|nr:3'-5'-exoribonuclease [Dimargaris xerosporica]
MVKDAEPSNNDQKFLLEALAQGLRIDGRGPDEPRRATVTYPQLGLARVALGHTKVMAQVSCEVARPLPERPTEGFLTIATELGTMASPSFEALRTEEEIVINRHIEKTLRRSRAIDTEGLCIVAGEKAWSIRVDLHFLDHDGNLIDAACLAAIAALRHFRRPEVTVVGEDVTIHPLDERNPVPLSIHHVPISVTFAFFEAGNLWVLDPTLTEERVCDGQMAITVNSNREICAISKPGGIPLETDVLLKCTELAAARAQALFSMIKHDQTAMDVD